MLKVAYYYLCMVTYDGIHSERYVTEKLELCYPPGHKFAYVQTYDTRKPFDMKRLWSICTDKCEHYKR